MEDLKCNGFGCRMEAREPVTMIDNRGFVYCTRDGEARRANGTPCRRLRPVELRALQAGRTIWYDTRRNTRAFLEGSTSK